MSKRLNGGKSKQERPMVQEAGPPLLSEELIAQLQGAVNAARRKRMPEPGGKSKNPAG